MIQHLLAYGQSDQASFRDARVAATYSTITVPGTIASYFEDATAAFVLSIRKPYIIDPRTPLFQDTLSSPRASHVTLASWHGASVEREIQNSPAGFPPAFFTPQVVEEMVDEVVARQRNYGARAAGIVPKMNRYMRLLAIARGEPPPATDASLPGNPPESVLLPYFAVNSMGGQWWAVMQRVWAHAQTLPNAQDLRPVLCVGADQGGSLVSAVRLLDRAVANRPAGLSNEVVFWITGCDERTADAAALAELWQLVASHSATGVRLANLYGGFFSICLGVAGLAAFGNGLAYSEARSWPALDATGAAPARYYLRALHAFAPPATAEQVVSRQPSFQCDCAVCVAVRAVGRSIVSMDYGELKAHFALARQWEMELVVRGGAAGAAQQLDAAHADYQATAWPPGVRVATSHLSSWSRVLRSVGP